MSKRDVVSFKIRDKLASGTLPRQYPKWTRFGPGLGTPCDGCDQTIPDTAIDLELDFPNGKTLRLHDACARVWEKERRQLL